MAKRVTGSMSEVFLHETEAAIVVFDVRGFSRLCAELAPLELGLTLGRFYRHVEGCIDAWGGRLVKLAGDSVLAAWLANETAWPVKMAISAVAESRARKPAWQEKLKADGMPAVDYGVAAAAGPVLAGQLGTDRHRSFDLLGEPVNVAFKLLPFATARAVDHLLAMTVPDHPSVEVEGVELGGKKMRLYRLTEAP
jgi:class 3 adenylate cyclase